MKFRQQRAQEPEISLTPLIDVVFLLLIFFMVSTTFQNESELEVVLPEAGQESDQTHDNVVVVNIDARGRYEVQGTLIQSEERLQLRRTLAAALSGRRSDPVVIRADARTPHQAVVTAMDIASGLGVEKLAIMTTGISETTKK